MITWNGYAVAVLAIVVGLWLLDLISDVLNLSALRSAAPAELEHIFDADQYAQSQRYVRQSTQLGLVESTFSLVVFLGFWLAGGFGWWDEQVRQLATGEITAGLLFLWGLGLAGQLLQLPFNLLETFWLEEKYGFNRTNLRTFLTDLLKGILLAVSLGTPLLAAVIWFFARWPEAGWWIAWLAISGFSLLLTYVAPRWILPLFNKFQPLADGELKQRIEALAQDCAFPLKEIWIMDGSRRSSKSNAFFTGLGRNKRIALFDTLVQNHTTDQLLAILAHEIGHYKRFHIQQQLVLGVLQMGLMTFLLGQVMQNEPLFAAMGVRTPSIYGSLTFFTILYRPVSRLLSVGLNVLSRRNEYEADAYAAQVVQSPQPLIEALQRLAKDNLANLTPHPFYVFMHYSHPPMRQRIAALAARS